MNTASLRALWLKFSHPELYELSDEELMVRVQQDDHKSFRILYDRYKNNIYQWVAWTTGRTSVAEELAQDIFLKVYDQRGRFIPTSFRAWLYTIARNHTMDYLRKKQEVLVSDESELENGEWEEIQSEEEQLILAQDKQWILNKIEQLAPRLREALTLWLSEEWSFEQMGELLGCSDQAAKNLVHRAKRELFLAATEREL